MIQLKRGFCVKDGDFWFAALIDYANALVKWAHFPSLAKFVSLTGVFYITLILILVETIFGVIYIYTCAGLLYQSASNQNISPTQKPSLVRGVGGG